MSYLCDIQHAKSFLLNFEYCQVWQLKDRRHTQLLNCFLDVLLLYPQWHHAAAPTSIEGSKTFLPFRWRGRFEDLTHVSGEMKPQMMLITVLSIGSVTTFFVFPIKLLFNHCCRNVYARCTEVLAEHSLFLKDRDVLPISHQPCTLTYIKLKIHPEIPGHTHRLQKFQNINKWRKHLTAWISVSRSQIHWVAFRGWPSMAYYECWLCTVWVSIVAPPPHFVKGNITPCASHLPGHRRWAGHWPR